MDKEQEQIKKEIEIIKYLEAYRKEYGDKFVIDMFESDIINMRNINISQYFLMKIKGSNFKEHENIVLEGRNADYSMDIVKKYEDADIRKHAEIIIESKDPKYNYKIAKYEISNNIGDEYIDVHKQIVKESKDPKWCYLYARDIPGIEKSDLEKIVIDSNSVEYNELYAKNIEDANLKDHHLVVLLNGSKKDIERFEEKVGVPIYDGLNPKRVKTLIKEINNQIDK